MSADENIKDETELAEKPAETQSKPTKDRKNRKDKVKPMAKVIVRRLPPTMTEEEFLKQIEPIPDHDYFYYVPADWSLGLNATCRAYINFCNQNDIFIFRDKFDGYVFVDTRGSEYPAIVEFAPFQGLPKGKSRKKDQKVNSIETEAHYLAFLESIKDEDVDGKSEMKMEYSFQLKDDQKITSTPLLEYLANVRQERRDERKRKIEDRKRQREEEKQRKKNQVAKSMPKTIDEDFKENDDGIIVRTIKSRPLDRDRNKKNAESSSNKGDKAKENKSDALSSRAEREKQRNKERQARRKEERERIRKEKESNRSKPDIVAPKEPIVDKDVREPKEIKDDKEKIKKYSESRRERRSRAEQKQSTDTTKSNQSKSKPSENGDDNEYTTTSADNDGKSNNSEKRERRAQRERSITNLRNKDRPSLQIYQPGKRRANPQDDNKSSNDGKDSKSLPQSGTDDSEKQASDTSTKQSHKIGEQSKYPEQQQDGRKKLSNEKRVSRYSEKRKAKEKRDLAIGDENDGVTGDDSNIEKNSICNEASQE